MIELNSARTKGWDDELQRYVWYYGDTFDFIISAELVDEDDQLIDIKPTDKLIVEFKNQRNQVIKTFEQEINNAYTSIVCHFDEDTSKIFGVGVYSYVIRFRDQYITTIGVDNYCEVLACGQTSY